MSRHGEISRPWGDGDYTFRLGIKELQKVQEACGDNVGPEFIIDRLRPYDPIRNPRGGNWLVQDIRETIRIGLIGGGKTQGEALSLINKFVDEVPLLENRVLAIEILVAGIAGSPAEPLGKAAGARKTKATSSRENKSPSPDSMATAQ